MRTTYCIAASREGTLSELLSTTPAAAKAPTLDELLDTLAGLAFIVETVAHLQGKERELLPTADKARKLVDFFRPTVADCTATAPVVTRPYPVTFDNSRYECSHRKAPRGRGLWLFEFAKGDPVFQHNGTLAEAKAAAREYLTATYGASVRNRVVYVCP